MEIVVFTMSFFAIYGIGGLVTTAIYFWQRRYALQGNDPFNIMMTAGWVIWSWPILALVYVFRAVNREIDRPGFLINQATGQIIRIEVKAYRALCSLWGGRQ